MSTADIKASLHTFLTSSEPTVIGLTGAWGRGKTYFWRSVLTEVRDRSKFPHYSYVSLFGLSTMQQLRDAVFENGIPSGSIDDPPEETFLQRAERLSEASKASPFMARVEGLVDSARETGARLIRKGGKVADSTPKLNDLGPFIKAAAFLSVKKYLICFDDLERRGKDLPLRDVLGLAGLLRDQRKCRVIVILNTDELEEEDRTTFDRLREKAFDYDLAFRPPASECAAIAFPSAPAHLEAARELTARLGITNIRILFRIRRAIEALFPTVSTGGQILIDQLVTSSVLLGWRYNAHDTLGPPYAYMRGLTRSSFFAQALAGTRSAEDKKWNAFLAEHKYTDTDELDSCVCQYLEDGYLDLGRLQAAVTRRVAALAQADRVDLVSEAWAIYHASLAPNDSEFADALYTATAASLGEVHLLNLDTTVWMLKRLGDRERAQDLLTKWIEDRETNAPGDLDLSQYGFEGQLKDPDVIAQASQAYNDSLTVPPVSDVIARLCEGTGWSQRDDVVLSSATLDDFLVAFRASTDGTYKRLVKECLAFAQHRSQTDGGAVLEKVTGALKVLARESPLNAIRLESVGISP